MACQNGSDTAAPEDTWHGGVSATVTCTFYDSSSNAPLVETYRSEVDVDEDGEAIIDDMPIGEDTTDEMCLAVIGRLQPAE